MKKLFTNDVFFAFAAIIGFVGELLLSIIASISYPQSVGEYIVIFLSGLLSLFLYISYKKHNKNAMKALMGAILMAEISSAACSVGTHLFTPFFVYIMLQFALAVILFINHISINSVHTSSPKKVLLNQIICVLLAITVFAWDINGLFQCKNAIEVFSVVCDMVGHPCMIASIVCVESRLDAYRLDREAAGWTEEAGYPKGYVHEYEKKDNK